MKFFLCIVFILFTLPLLLLSSAFFPALLPELEEHDITAFVNVAVVPMTREQVIMQQTVIVRKDRIAEIGPSKTVRVPEGAFVVDGPGNYLMPGLCDMHVHLHSRQDLLLLLANGVTTVRNLRGTPLHLSWRKQIAEGRMIGPTIYTAGPMLDGFPPSGENATIIETPEDAKQAVLFHKKEGFDFVKVYNRLSVEAYRALMAECKANGLRVVGHVPTAVGLDGALQAHQDSIEHLTAYIVKLKEGPLWDFYKGNVPDSKLRELAYETRSAGVWNCPTLVVQEKLASAKEYDEWKKRPEWNLIAPLRLKLWEPSREGRLTAMSEKDFAAAKQGIEILKRMTKALAQSGAGILLGTDEPSRFVVPGFSAHEELANLVEAGLTPYQAVRAGTRDAAEYLGGLREFGTVEVGKRADLILLKGHPFNPIGNTTRIAGVMVRGHWLPHAKLQQLLANITSSYAPRSDRFATMPRLMEGTVARYSIRQGDLIIGEERFVVTNSTEGKTEIHAQQVTDPPYDAVYTLDLQLDSAGEIQELRLSFERPEGPGELRLVRDGAALKLIANLPEQSQLQSDDSLAAELDFSASMVATRLPFFRKLKTLVLNGSVEKELKELDLWIFFGREQKLIQSKWTIRRDGDITRNFMGTQKSASVFTLSRNWNRLIETGSVLLDDQDLPLLYELGWRTFERIQ
jgi:imidazolonepropionase-like amidohydrolase